jgi:hypothetical protein
MRLARPLVVLALLKGTYESAVSRTCPPSLEVVSAGAPESAPSRRSPP